ncbi:hypothetical protein S83_057398 [Arachis hypogaea]
MFQLQWTKHKIRFKRYGCIESFLEKETSNPSWKLSLPHVLVGTLSSFLFGYHLGVVNEPLESISRDLGFRGNTLAEGLVVSMCLGGALIGSLFSGWIADAVGCRRAFRLCALPMIIGASMRMVICWDWPGSGPSCCCSVSPSFVRGTYGALIQIATCLDILGPLLIGIPVKEISGWWRVCFGASTIPAGILVLGMVFCAESPHWLYKQGRIAKAEATFERLLMGASEAKFAICYVRII